MSKDKVKNYFLIFLKAIFIYSLYYGKNYITNKNQVAKIQKQYFTDSEIDYSIFIETKIENDENIYVFLHFEDSLLHFYDIEEILSNEKKFCLFVYIDYFELFCSYRKKLASNDISYDYSTDCFLDFLEELISYYKNNSKNFSNNQEVLEIDLAKAMTECPEIFEKFKNNLNN